MRDLVLRSILIAMLVIPFVAAREPDPRRALVKGVLWFLGFNVFYMLALRFVYPALA